MSKQITFGLTVLIITTNNLVNSVITCTMPWKKVHRGCYMFNTHLSTWYDAQQICQRNGGYLASMSSRAEAVRVLLNIRTSSMKHWWLGLSLNKTIAKWKWEDGSDLHTSVIAWKPGEPNKSLRDEQCGEMNIQGKLNDQKCDSLNPFICEQYPPTLSPLSKDAATTQDPETTTDVPDSNTRNVEKPQCDPLEEYKRSWPSASEGDVVSCPCKTETGGGPPQKTLSTIAMAVSNVVGENNTCLSGIPGGLDTSIIQLGGLIGEEPVGINIIEGPPDTVPHILDPESLPPPSPSSWMLPLSRGHTNYSNPKRKIEELTLKKLELEVQYLELKIKKLKKEE